MRRALIDYFEKSLREEFTAECLVAVLAGEYGIQATEDEVRDACDDLGVVVL